MRITHNAPPARGDQSGASGAFKKYGSLIPHLVEQVKFLARSWIPDSLLVLAMREMLLRLEEGSGGPESGSFDPDVSRRVDALRFLLGGEGGRHE